MKKIKFKSHKGNTLTGIIYNPKKNKRVSVIMSHGFLLDKDGPSGLYKNLSKELCKKGYEVLRFDFSYCGESNGKISDLINANRVKDLRSAIEQVKNKSLILIGHSAGGITSLTETFRNKRVIKLITLGIPLKMKPMAKKVRSSFKKRYKISLVDQIKLMLDYRLRANKNLLNKLNKLKIPTLFMYTPEDIYCDYSEINKLGNKNIKKLKIINTNHYFKNKEKLIINKIINFIENGR